MGKMMIADFVVLICHRSIQLYIKQNQWHMVLHKELAPYVYGLVFLMILILKHWIMKKIICQFRISSWACKVKNAIGTRFSYSSRANTNAASSSNISQKQFKVCSSYYVLLD